MIEDYVSSLNQNQKDAVFHDGNLLALAGAGSGKTRVLTTKVARALEMGVSASSILAITFTNKAATEMRRRIISMHASGAGVKMKTFHSFGAGFLRENYRLAGKSKGFTIWGDSNQKSVVRHIINADKKKFDLLSGSPDVRSSVANMVSWISKVKESSLDKVIKVEEFDPTDAQAFVLIEYQKKLESSNAVDFNDLIRIPVMIMMDHKDTIPIFEYILIDELQDSDENQFQLLVLLGSKCKSISAVGDDDQAIYEWRGAKPSNVARFQQHFSARLVKLEENYRSNPRIVTAANDLIKGNTMRMGKNMIPVRPDGFPIFLLAADDQIVESNRIASFIVDVLLNDPNEQFAILYRENRQSRPLEFALRRNRINYILYKGIDFINRLEIVLMLNVFRLSVNHHDFQALASVLGHFGNGFGPTAIAKLEMWQANADKDAVFYGKDSSSVRFPLSESKRRVYVNSLRLLREMDGVSLIDIEKHIDEEMSYELTSFTGDKDNQKLDRMRNLQELFIWISEYCLEHLGATLLEFLNDASLDTSSSNNDSVASVHLMTIHASKGLEFPVVFVAGCAQSIMPGSFVSELSFHEEARRLFYVAMTRAMDTLILSYPALTHKGYSDVSEFVEDISEHLSTI